MADMLRDVATFQKVDELMRVCRSAVRIAQAESRRLGVANVYSFEGQIYYELPSGEFSRSRPNPPASTGRVTTSEQPTASGSNTPEG